MNKIAYAFSPPEILSHRVILTGYSGEKYHFGQRVIAEDINYPTSKGVYAFCSYEKDQIEILYIGVTDCLCRTLTGDISWHPNWCNVINAKAHIILFLSINDGDVTCESVLEDLKQAYQPSFE